jgi:hypothetical protein
MKEQRITIDIDAEGRISADAEGFEGDLCLKELEKLLEGCTSAWEQVERKPDTARARVGGARVLGLKQGGKP